MSFNDLLSKGHDVRKTKTWTDEQGRTHKKSVGGWYGNPLLNVMPYLIGIFIGLIFLITDPWAFPLIIVIVAIYMVGFFIFNIVYDYKMKHVWTEENGWKTTSLSPAAEDVKRLFHGEYNDYKLIRELKDGKWTYFAHNIYTGDHIEYPEKVKEEDFSVRQMDSIINWLKQQIDKKELK